MKRSESIGLVIVLLLVAGMMIYFQYGRIPFIVKKTLAIEKGKLIKESLYLLVPESSLSIDYGNISENSFPKGVGFQGASIVGVSKEDGKLTITLTWNQEKDRYETNVSFDKL